MEQKLNIKDLYKKRKLVKVTDGKGNYAEINIQTVSYFAKNEAAEKAAEARAKLISDFNDEHSKESVILNESLLNMSKEKCVRELTELDMDLMGEIEAELNEKGLEDTASKEFIEEYNKRFSEEKTKKIPGLNKKTIDELRAQVRKNRINNMINAYYVRVFNETVLFYAMIDESGERLFKSIEEMEENLHGNLFNELKNAYYNLDFMDVKEAKN